MRQFVYSSTHLIGEVLLGYSENDLLVFFDLSKAQLTEAQHATFIKFFPLTLTKLKELIASDKENRRIVEVVNEITFETFWETYDHKALSHKKKSVAIWNKLSMAERIKAYQHLNKYFYQIKVNNTPKMYANTYLNSEIWNN